MIKVKNKTYQPLPLVVDGKTILVPARKHVFVKKVTQQMQALKARGLLQVIRK